MGNKRFIGIFFAAIIAILLIIGSGNYIIDPFGLHYHSRYTGFNLHKPAFLRYERVSKLFNADAINPDAIFLGNSRILYLAPEEAFSEYLPYTYYNFSFSSGSVGEMDKLLAYSIRNYDIRYVCYGVDFISICDQLNQFAENFDHELIDGNKFKELEFIKLHTSTTAILESYDCVAGNIRDPEARGIIIQYNKFGSRTNQSREMGYSRWGETWIEDQISRVLETYKSFYFAPGLHLPDYNKSAYISILDQCHKNNIEYTAYINPLYKDQFELLIRSTAYPAYIEFLEFLAHHGGIWYFGGTNAITSDNQYFWDAQHPRKALSFLISDCILSGKSQAYSDPLFGTYYDASNINILTDTLNKIRQELFLQEEGGE